MSALLKFSLWMDWISSQLGKVAAFTVLSAALISAGNAFVRFGLNTSSNAWLEIQWYLFAATVMFGAPVVLKLNEHVRVDIIYGKLQGQRTGLRGPVRPALLSAAGDGHHRLAQLAALLQHAAVGRNVEQLGRPDPLARHAAAAAGLCA